MSISGNIGAGKSTVIQELKKHHPGVKFYNEKVHLWRLLQPYYENPKLYALSFQIILLGLFQELLEYGFVVSERTPADSRHVFAEMLHDDGVLSEQEWQHYLQVYKYHEINPSVIIYLQVDVDVAFDRIQFRNRRGEKAITLGYLQKLETYSQKWLEIMQKRGVVVHLIDSNQPLTVVTKQVHEILSLYTRSFEVSK